MKQRILACLTILLFMACCSSNDRDNLQQLKAEIQAKVGTFPEATVAVVYKNLASNEILAINEKEMMHAASTMKVPVMIEVFKQAEEDRFNLDDSVVVKNEFKSIMDGSLYAMDIGEDSDESIYDQINKKMTIRDLTNQMITVSSNLATNLLIERVGVQNVTKTMQEIGAHDIQVLRGVEDLKAYRAGKNNVTDAHDLMLVMAAIAQKQVVTAQACEQMIEILRHQKFNDKIPALLPASVKVAHKTGSITKIDHDFGIVYPRNYPPYILVVLTKGIADKKQAENLISEISKLIYDYHSNSPT
ncbi:MAG: serine hydrolase [bacterium]